MTFQRKIHMLPKEIVAMLSLLFFALTVSCQTHRIDSLRNKLVNATDTVRPFLLNKMAEEITDSLSSFSSIQQDSFLGVAKNCVNEAEALSRKLNYGRGIGLALILSGDIKVNIALRNFDQSINDYANALPYLTASKDKAYRAYGLNRIATGCHFIGKLDSSIAYYDSAITCFLELQDTLTATRCMIWQGHDYFDKGDYKSAYLFGTRALNAAQKTKDTSLIIFANQQFEGLFLNAGLPERTIDYLHTIIKLHPLTMPKNGRTTLPDYMPWALWVAGEAYLKLNEIDSAVYLSQFIPEDTTDGDSYRFYGQLYTALDQDDKAMKKFVRGFELKREVGHEIGLAGTANELGQIYLKKKDFKSATYYAHYGLATAERIHALLEKRNAVGILSDIYSQTGNFKEAYYYSQLYKSLNDSLASERDRKKMTLDLIQSELDNQKQQSLLLSQENRIKQQQLHGETLLKNFFIAGAIVLLLVAIIIFRNYRQKQKANNLLEEQKKEIQATLSELRSTQAQLIQSEKMASLGELTAGIAHEIQNPLNFVNNFSDVNTELIDEAEREMMKGNISEAQSILNDVKDNEQKINHHGKRADSIVKGMLQHSRTSSGQKEPTDMNKLADEYLRLAYHGLRAKDKSFNAEIKTDFDGSLGKINIVPQDIGRVLLNLINNAFYTVNERKKLLANSYEPLVLLTTKRKENLIEIKIKDNGNGIPPKILDKIFQPFFTTKPTGEGTGLGLSLAYDIVKAHGGEIKVESKENEGSIFTIQLSVS